MSSDNGQAGMGIDSLPGLYRGRVEATDDPETRSRYRVRIFAVHAEETIVEHLPWAEMTAFGGKGFGDTPFYDLGDLVWCMFEAGNPEYPVLIGGWLSESQGVPDLAAEQRENYQENRQRWMRRDKSGNLIEMSAVSGQDYVRMKSGRAEVRVTRGDDGIVVDARGPVTINVTF